MTETIISLLSILFGILGAVIFGKLKPKCSFGFSGNAILGVFGSILLIKTLGGLGFAPNFIVIDNKLNNALLALNLTTSVMGAVGFLLIIKSVYKNTQSKN